MAFSAQYRPTRLLLIRLIGLYVLLSAAIAGMGILIYRGQEQHVYNNAKRELSTIAELKTHELMRWRQDRFATSAVFHKNPAFATLFKQCLQNPADTVKCQQLLGWLITIKEHYSFDQIHLVDTAGNTLFLIPTGQPVPGGESELYKEILRNRQPVLSDFYSSSDNHRIYLAIRVPILDPQQGETPIGLLSIRIDPELYIYPYILRWPGQSKSAETLLARREGDEIVYLNNLRFRNDSALKLRAPLMRTEIPAVRAALGESGIVEGVDYYGKPVIADVRSVPDSPWYLITRMDTEEVQERVQEKLWMTIWGMMALLALVALALARSWWRQRVAYYYDKALLSESLRQKTNDLELANQELEAFNYSLSHDLRSHVARIQLASETMQKIDSHRLSQQGKFCQKSIADTCQHMEELITTMLKLARISRHELQLEEVDLSGIVQQISLELTVLEPDRVMQFNIAPGLTGIGDKQLLQVAMENLLSNACKYTKMKAVALISFNAEQRNGRQVYALSDNGCGFDMAEAGKLFQAFQRLTSAKDFSGFGIGLTTVERIIQRHGGEIWAEAIPGEGATFYFTLRENPS